MNESTTIAKKRSVKEVRVCLPELAQPALLLPIRTVQTNLKVRRPPNFKKIWTESHPTRITPRQDRRNVKTASDVVGNAARSITSGYDVTSAVVTRDVSRGSGAAPGAELAGPAHKKTFRAQGVRVLNSCSFFFFRTFFCYLCKVNILNKETELCLVTYSRAFVFVCVIRRSREIAARN